jgi:transposase
MRAYSTDLREKIALAYERGERTFDEIAETFGVARCTVGRLLRSARSGDGLAPKPHGGVTPPRSTTSGWPCCGLRWSDRLTPRSKSWWPT